MRPRRAAAAASGAAAVAAAAAAAVVGRAGDAGTAAGRERERESWACRRREKGVLPDCLGK